VNHPEALLENGRDSAFFGEGEQAARRKFNAPALAAAKNVVELHLKLEEK